MTYTPDLLAAAHAAAASATYNAEIAARILTDPTWDVSASHGRIVTDMARERAWMARADWYEAKALRREHRAGTR